MYKMNTKIFFLCVILAMVEAAVLVDDDDADDDHHDGVEHLIALYKCILFWLPSL